MILAASTASLAALIATNVISAIVGAYIGCRHGRHVRDRERHH